MDEGFSNPTNIAWQGDVGVVEYGGGDRGMVCTFYNDSQPDPIKSLEAGRPINRDVVMVTIHPPGERLNIVNRPAHGGDARRFPTQYAQFMQRQVQTPDGTPVSLLYPERPSVAATLRAHAVHTMEQLADLSGPAIDSIGMGAQEWVNTAKKYLEMSNKGVTASVFRHEIETLTRENKLLAQQVQDLVATVHQLKDRDTTAAGLAQVQAMIAGAMARPEHLPSRGFDAQAAMIAATHPTRVIKEAADNQLKRRTR